MRFLAFIVVWLTLAVPAFAVIAKDGSAATCSSATTTIACTLTTSGTTDVCIATIASASGTASVPAISGISGGTGLTWANRKTLSGTTLDYGFGAGDGTLLAEWFAVSTSAQAGTTITATVTNNSDGNMIMQCFSGVNTTTPFDVNVSMPGSQTSATHAIVTPSIASLSTTNANTAVLALVGGYFSQAASTFPITGPSGFTLIADLNNAPTFSGQQGEFEIISSALSSATVAYGSGYNDFYYIVDAIQASGAAPPTCPLTRSRMGVGC